MCCNIIILLIVLLAILFPLSFPFPFLFFFAFSFLPFFMFFESFIQCVFVIFNPPTTPLQFSSPALPTQLYVLKKKSFKTKLCCSNIFGCVVCPQKLQDYLDSYSLKENCLSLSWNLPIVCSTPLSTVGFVLTWTCSGLVHAVSTAVSSCV